MARCGRVGGSGVGALMRKRGRALRYLDISFCSLVGHDTVERIRKNYPRLRLNAKLDF